MNMTFQAAMPAIDARLIPTSRTFSEAADSYLKNGGCDRFLSPIIEHFNGRLMSDIFPFDIKQMSIALYPTHSASTRNRQAITPARAVFSHEAGDRCSGSRTSRKIRPRGGRLPPRHGCTPSSGEPIRTDCRSDLRR